MSLQACAQEVLKHYPPLLRGNLVFLGNQGGFSGARLWRLSTGVGDYCLKAHAPQCGSARDLQSIHDLLARAAVFPWMPRIMRTSAGVSFVAAQGRLWDIATWMPGRADFLQAPTAARLQSACTALAQLHLSWAPPRPRHDVCPAVRRRLDSWQTWQNLVQSGWRPDWQALAPYASIAECLWQQVARLIDEVPPLLAPWLERRVLVQPCVCDLWHEHVLYSGADVTGLIDFGSVKEDHIAVDLARLCGSLLGHLPGACGDWWETGFAAYERICPPAVTDGTWVRVLTRTLDRTGTILAATHWLRWLYEQRRTYDQPEAVLRRLTALSERLQQLP